MVLFVCLCLSMVLYASLCFWVVHRELCLSICPYECIPMVTQDKSEISQDSKLPVLEVLSTDVLSTDPDLKTCMLDFLSELVIWPQGVWECNSESQTESQADRQQGYYLPRCPKAGSLLGYDHFAGINRNFFALWMHQAMSAFWKSEALRLHVLKTHASFITSEKKSDLQTAPHFHLRKIAQLCPFCINEQKIWTSPT